MAKLRRANMLIVVKNAPTSILTCMYIVYDGLGLKKTEAMYKKTDIKITFSPQHLQFPQISSELPMVQIVVLPQVHSGALFLVFLFHLLNHFHIHELFEVFWVPV
jgi:hypothetical protein